MESKNPHPGDELPSDDDMIDAGQTTAETQPDAELSADSTTQGDLTPNEPAAAGDEPAPVAEASDEVPDADADEAAGELDSTDVDADDEAPEAVAEAVTDAPESTDEHEDYEAVGAVDIDEDEDDEDEEEEPDSADEGPKMRRGDLVDGVVIETSPTEVRIDLGEGLVGVVASRELERMDRLALESLIEGSPVTAYVLKAKGADGNPVLSLARAEEELNWRMAQEHFDSQDVYFSKVAGYNKGGLIVRFGKVRGFVPASQISRERQQRASGDSPEKRWGSMVGDDIAVKVVEMDRSRNRLILSERAAAREWREKQKSRLLEELQVGETRTGRVISLADFGAFVDLGGADGLVHLTELSWKHVTHPREVLRVGQEVEVQVISVDRARKRIGLSMKRSEDDPWSSVPREYAIGQLVQATVTKLTKFGAFARLVDSPEIEGLIHISELADYRVNHPRDVVLVGDVLTLRIVKIDPDQRRLGLSLRQVDSAKFMDQDWQAIVDEIGGDEEDEPAEPIEPEEPADIDELAEPDDVPDSSAAEDDSD